MVLWVGLAGVRVLLSGGVVRGGLLVFLLVFLLVLAGLPGRGDGLLDRRLGRCLSMLCSLGGIFLSVPFVLLSVCCVCLVCLVDRLSRLRLIEILLVISVVSLALWI